MRCGWVIALLVGCGGASRAPAAPAPVAPTAPLRPVSPMCLPLVQADLGFHVPDGWIAERADQGRWDLGLDSPDGVVANVRAARIAVCTAQDPRVPSPPLATYFPDGYVIDEHESGAEGDDAGRMITNEACVPGERGALHVTVYGHDAKYDPQIRAILVTIGEATDGAHACSI